MCQVHCGEKRNASKFLALLKEVGSVDSQIALLLQKCEGFCRMVHIGRCTPPSVALEGLHLFDEEVCQTFSDSMCIDPSDLVWQQAWLSLVLGFAVHHYTHQQHSCLPFRCRALLPTLVTIFSDLWTTLMHVFPRHGHFD